MSAVAIKSSAAKTIGTPSPPMVDRDDFIVMDSPSSVYVQL